MTIFARPPARLARTRPTTAPGKLALGLLVALIATLFIAAPASALVAEVSGDTVGLQPRSEASVKN